MESRIIVDRVWLTENGQRINYGYRATGRAAKYFRGRPLFTAKYDVDLAAVPDSVLLIPLAANLAPIAWLAGVPLDMPRLDATFIASLNQVKGVFMRDYPSCQQYDSPIRVVEPIDTACHGQKQAMLFSGGVDAYATFFRHRTEGFDLISVRGADIPLADKAQWASLVDLSSREGWLSECAKRYVEANLRDFYTYHVNLLVPTGGWWGAVQHGLALNSLVAPLSILFGYSRIYIASTHTEAIKIKWGSSPEIDNKIAWSGCRVVHDGYELTRMDKIGLIFAETERASREVNLRVCYSELNMGLNCSNCEKCFRTMLGLSLCGADPGRYGFEVGSDTYSRILELINLGFRTEGVRYLWWQFHQRMQTTSVSDIHLLGEKGMCLAVQHALAAQLELPIQNVQPSAMKLALIERFPGLFGWYLKARRRFS